MLPDDNPGDFSYFFDSSGRRTCYIAPERFYASGETAPAKPNMTWAMDIFSAGCVIAQMFLESEIFSLAQLYKYRRGEYDPVITHLSVISDKDVRDMIAHMIQLDPQKRYSADQYLEFWKGKVFPSYFYNFLHQYMELVTDPSSGNSPMSSAQKNMGESDDRIDRVYYDFDKISYFLGYNSDKKTDGAPQLKSKLGLSHFPVRLSIPNHAHLVSSDMEPPEDDGTLLFLTLIVSSIRTTARASSRIRACDLLLAFSERITDEAKLDRVLPYLMTLLRKDEPDVVIITAIRTITQLLQMVQMVTPINSHVVTDYIFPRMEFALGSKARFASPLVRATYASCLGSLAATAQRFLEMASSIRADAILPIADPEVELGSEPGTNLESIFDNTGQQLFEIVESHTKQLVEDPDGHVRRAFLSSVPELCMFFGELSNDVLLTHLNTYLNDRDWTLKCAFFDTIVGIATFIGSTTLEEFMLPLMMQALSDAEETVVQAAIHSLAQLASLGLLSRPNLWELVDLISRFTMHPNIWIREAAAEFISMSAKYLDTADVRCILLPMIKPYLKIETLSDFSELGLLDALKKPLSRTVFDQAIVWATQSDRGVFWKSMQQVRSMSLGSLGGRSSKSSALNPMMKMVRNEEDEQWLEKLRNLGLKSDDELKLLALREFIWKLSKMKSRDSSPAEPSMSTGLISLKNLGVTPQTVFFDDTPLRDPTVLPDLDPPIGQYTIADALLDASMTIDDSVSKRRKAAPKPRVHSAGPSSSHGTRRLLSPAESFRDTRRASATSQPTTPDDASVQDGTYAARRAMRHQSSALSLLDRKDGNKSIPETGTSDANAFGKVEGPFLQTSEPSSPNPNTKPPQPTRQTKHSYEGNDPNIQSMLDNMYIDNFPRDVIEFGPMVDPVSKSKDRSSTTQPGRWKPEGHLVATFGEHRGPINRIAASPDHMFFITGGDDGAVKVWDTARLERNITHRSRQTHKHADGARVMSLCFIENSHCFVSAASDGSIHVVKVDTVSASGVVRYGKLRTLREYRLPSGEYAVWSDHFRQESNSVLILATNRSRILGIDLRTMSLLFTLENPVHHGTPTCFCIDKKKNWLCLGTTHGVVDLWDLRFKMRLRGWGLPGKTAIHRITVHPAKGRGKWICVSGGTSFGEVTVWDLEKTACREIYRVGGSKDGPKGYTAWDVDEEKPEGMLARFATDLETTDTADADKGVRAMAIGTVTGDDSRDVRHAFILTGGADKRLRFWDVARVENSTIYSGLLPEESTPTYAMSHPTTGLTLNVEKFPRASQATGQGSGNNATAAAAASSRSKTGRPPRSTVISLQQQQLLQSHLDSVLDMVLLEAPYPMSVSVDRSGIVFVFR